MKVLVVNAGSSSLKYQLLDTATKTVLAKGNCERIGIDGHIEHRKGENGEKIKADIAMPTHAVAIETVIKYLTDKETGVIADMSEIEAVGHRVVHGGPYFFDATPINEAVMDKIALCYDFAPLHTNAALMGMRGCLSVMPNTPQVAVFDTAFYKTLPEQAYTYGISYDIAEKYQIRRYGAHGTSHKFVSREAAKVLGKPLEELKLVTCHIGNGSSISAVDGGKCIDTTMGLTPLEGVIMGTRCGSMDPAVVTFIMEREGWTPSEMSEYMNKKCGFLGMSGISSDSRDIEAAILKGDHRAYLAASTLAYQIKKYIGSFAAAMNGLDAVIFTAGMGENNPEVRSRSCANLDYMGIKIDEELNAKVHHQSDTVRISTPDSKVSVWVLPTNEELMIANETEAKVKGN